MLDMHAIKQLLQAVKGGSTSVESALERLHDLPFTDLGYAKLDHHRALRSGFPEVVFCQGKTPEQAAGAMAALAARHGCVLATRADAEQARAIEVAVPYATYHPAARLIVASVSPVTPDLPGKVLVLTAGTADIPVAEEAALTAEAAGCPVQRTFDVGVAGLQRLLAQLPLLREASVIVAVAGMEGALPGVVAGLTNRPVIAVPTSIGYGTGTGGLVALLGMLNACAPGLTVTNIDNGFGAGMMAARINRLMKEALPDGQSES